MENFLTVTKSIIQELQKIQNSQQPYLDDNGKPEIPSFIGIDREEVLIVNRKIDDKIRKISLSLIRDDERLKRKVTQREWFQSVRRKLGPILASVELDDDPDQLAQLILKELKLALKVDSLELADRDHYFGCTLFSNMPSSTFQIGPVTFENRRDWLTHLVGSGQISSTTQRRILRVWDGRKVRPRKASGDSMAENGILDVVGNCPYVCSVSTKEVHFGAGRSKALLAARLSLTSIALFWNSPTRTLSGLNLLYDRQTRIRYTAVSSMNGKLQVGWNRFPLPHGPWISELEWNALVLENGNYFDVISEVLWLIANPDYATSRPKIIATLWQALHWFHEACREENPSISIVKFAATLDSLATGKGYSGILSLIQSRLGINPDQEISDGGPTLKNAVKQIYGVGRSRIIHGTDERVAHDVTDLRDLSEEFARLSLIRCFLWVHANPEVTEPDEIKRP